MQCTGQFETTASGHSRFWSFVYISTKLVFKYHHSGTFLAKTSSREFFFFYIKWYILPSNSTRSLSAARVFLSPRCPPWSGKVAVISPNSLSSLQCLAKYPPSNCATIQILFVQYIKFFLKKTLLRNSVYSGVRMFVWLWPSWITSPSFSRHEESVHFLYFSSVTMAPCS